MGMTMAEKVLAEHSGKKEVNPGQYVWAHIDGTALLGGSHRRLEEYGVEKLLIQTEYMPWKITLPPPDSGSSKHYGGDASGC